MAVDIKQFKTLMRVDLDDDDAIIEGYLAAAKNYIKDAIGPDDNFYTQSDVVDRYETSVYAYAGTLYTYRISMTETNAIGMDATVNSIVGQLRGKYAEWEEHNETSSV